uniref:Afadin-and alpha-actinin-binding protein n=1 Tax=Schistosoma mansoni TaxID=6183 RepID=A0A5K4F3Z3_SCHMA
MSHIPSIDYFNNAVWNIQPVFDKSSRDSSTSHSETFVVMPQSQLDSSIRLINSEFEIMGYSKVLRVENGETQITMNSFVDGVLKLISSYRKSLNSREEIELNFHRVQSDLTQVQKLYRRCQQNLEETQRSSELIKEREKQALNDKKLLNDRLKSTCNELRKVQSNFQRHEVQFLHERRKLEKEATDLRKRLALLIDKATPNWNKGQKTNKQSCSPTGLSMSQWFLSSEVGKKPEITNGEPSSSRRFGSSIRTNSGLGSTKFESLTSVNSFNSHIKYDWDVQTPRADLSSLIVQQLESRQNDLLYENRELRDLVSQLSSRIIRFTDFLQRHCTTWVQNNDNVIHSNEFDDEFFSLDDEEDDGDEYFRRESSDEDYSTFSMSKENGRGKSALVNNLLFELPYAVIRDDLTRRVRFLSRCLWCKLKCLAKHYMAKTRITTERNVTKNAVNSQTFVLDLPTSGGDNENNEVKLSKSQLAEVKSLTGCKSLLKEKELILEDTSFSSCNLDKLKILNFTSSNPELGGKNEIHFDKHNVPLLLKESSIRISQKNKTDSSSNSSDESLYSPYN